MDVVVKRKGTVVLGPRELQIAKSLSYGKTAKEIAIDLLLSRRTIETIIERMRKSVKADTQAHLVAIFIRKKLIK